VARLQKLLLLLLCSFPRRLITLCVDGVAILIGSLLGTSPLTVVAESSVGIKEGGRTGAARPRVQGLDWGFRV
jgi:xanthine/uracil/vitamin C permease (AzgA family)